MTSMKTLARLCSVASGMAALTLAATSGQAAVQVFAWTAGDYSGTVSYDDTAVTTSSSNYQGTGYAWYGGPDFVTTVNYQGSSYNFANQLIVSNNYYGTIDGYDFLSTGTPLGNYFEVQLRDNSGQAVNSLAPPSSIDAALFPTTQLYLGGPSVPMTQFAPAISAAVPETSTWAMTVGGFGLLGSTLRRRRPAITRAA